MKFTMTTVLAGALLSTSISALALPRANPTVLSLTESIHTRGGPNGPINPIKTLPEKNGGNPPGKFLPGQEAPKSLPDAKVPGGNAGPGAGGNTKGGTDPTVGNKGGASDESGGKSQAPGFSPPAKAPGPDVGPGGNNGGKPGKGGNSKGGDAESHSDSKPHLTT